MPATLSEIKIKDIMTTKIVAANAEDSVLDVAKIILEKDFDGVPVVDKKHKLVGMVTMKELLSNEGLYLPTVVEVFKGLNIYHRSDIPEFNKKLNFLKSLKVVSIMNRDPLFLIEHASLETAAEAFLLRHESPLPVLDDSRTLVGILTKYDLLKALAQPLKPLRPKPFLTMESEPMNVARELKKVVMVSRARVKFWYIAFLVFFALGILIALATILRIRIL